jgi:ABC-type sugar transport system permease subunit
MGTAVEVSGASKVLRRRAARVAVALILPAFVVLIAFRIVPLALSLWLGLTDWKGIGTPKFVGLDNYQALLSDPIFWASFKHTAWFVVAIPVWTLVPLGAAMAIHRRVAGWRIFRAAFYLPTILSPVVIGLYYAILLQFDGPVNSALRGVGLDSAAREWLVDPSTALMIVIAVVIWATFGIGVAIFLSALSAVDDEIIDAARVDGARWFSVQRFAVLPQILPSVLFWVFLCFITSLGYLFPYVFTLTLGGPGSSTYVLDFYVYQKAFFSGDFGYAAAMGTAILIIAAIPAAIAIAGFSRARRWRA